MSEAKETKAPKNTRIILADGTPYKNGAVFTEKGAKIAVSRLKLDATLVKV